jgi:hypothetical protein
MSFNFSFSKKKSSKSKISLVSFDVISDWKKLMSSLFILSFIGLAWSAYVFWGIHTGTAFTHVEVPQTTLTFPQTADLEKVSEVYEEKAKRFSSIDPQE